MTGKINITKRDCEELCWRCVAFLVILGLIITYWYVTVPIILIGCGIFLLIKRGKKKKIIETQYKQEEKKIRIYPINCKGCGTLINQVFCKYCHTNNQQSRTIPKAVQREVWRRDFGKCIECGSKEKLEYDHIIPFSKGGSNTVRNIQLLCENCNRKKSNKI